MNPVDYVIAWIIQAGLRDKRITIFFSIEELKLEKQNTFPMVVINITDEWQDKYRRMRDECRWMKMNERRVQTSKGKSRSRERRLETSEEE